ncbi:MAG: hypothetical protein IT162_06975 [Bryobacterales bacterium]|nr:hypothetical protein [Bryobacterales bacterium]
MNTKPAVAGLVPSKGDTSMSEREKAVRACLILALEAAQKMIKAVPKPSATLKEAGKTIGVLIKQLSDQGPETC